MNIIHILRKAHDQKIISSSDFFFATIIFKNESPKIILSAACVSYYTNLGHICLPISVIKDKKVFITKNQNLIHDLWKEAEKKGSNWIEEFKKSNVIGNEKSRIITPLIFSNKNNLYIHKFWQAEKTILKFISKKPQYKFKKLNETIRVLNHITNKNLDDIQKIAILISIISNITFIIGGPGTGKTTIIFQILTIFIQTSKKKLNIKLTAPTGKATQRLINSITNSINQLQDTTLNIDYLTKNTMTLHSLLGLTQNNQFKCNYKISHLINLDLLIIDESSMIDIFIMEKIINLVPKKTKIIFLGDYNQLPPINHGQILKDICNNYQDGFSKEIVKILNNITHLKINIIKKNKLSNLNDKIITLKKNYRVNIHSDIYIISKQIHKKTPNYIKKLFFNDYKNIRFISLPISITLKRYTSLICEVSQNYINYWKSVIKLEKLSDILYHFNKNRLLCALNEGLFGVKELNSAIEKQMKKNGWIRHTKMIQGELWYLGKPIIISKNNKTLKLLNGDIGITMLDKNQELMVNFIQLNKKNKLIPINLLPKHQTNWAMTVHKSQGSEFNHIIFILPNYNNEIVNKELIYTAITRSCNEISIYSNKNIFIQAINRETLRKSGMNLIRQEI